MGVAGPLAQVYRLEVVDVVEQLASELTAFGQQFSVEIVAHTLRLLALGERGEFVEQDLAQFFLTCAVLLVELSQLRVAATGAFLHGTGKEAGADDHALQRRVGLQRSVFHITGLVAEDGAEQLLLGGGIALALRSDFTNQDVARHDVRTHADDTALVEVLGGVLAHVGDVVGEFLHASLGLTHLEGVLVDVDRGQDILTHHALVEHDSVLIVVTLPGHVSHLKVAAQSQLAVLGRVTLGEDVALAHALSAFADGAQVDGRALVGLAELRQMVHLYGVVKRHEVLLLSAVVADADNVGVDIFHHARALGLDLSAAVVSQTLLDASTHDGSLAAKQGHCLAHHVGAHQRTVSIVVLQEGD